MRNFLFILINIFCITNAFSQAGSNDPTFNHTDIGFGNGDGANITIQTTALQSDGKIIIGGDFTYYNGTAINKIARLNTDGTLDATFNPGTGANNTIETIALQSDGKIIIGGSFTYYNGTAINYIARLNANGTLDATFDPPGTGANDRIYTTALQSDGKIIIGGRFTAYNGTVRNRIARLYANGTLDATFNPGTGVNGNIYTTALQSDGKIIIGGFFSDYNGTVRNRIARLNTNGTLDATFNPVAGANSTIYSTALQSDGKIIIGGAFSDYNGTARNRIARLNANGTLDATFNPVAGANSTIYSIALQSDGKIIIGGAFSDYNGAARNRIARLNANGTLDVTFNPGTGANDFIYTTALQSDGKIIISGAFTVYNGIVINRIARLNANGTLDATFNRGTGANSTIFTTSLQSDGKIIIGGEFTAYNGTPRNYIARLNANGTLDATFNLGTGANSTIYTTALQSDGKIIIGGDFTAYNGTARNRIARLNADGTLDATFNPETGANTHIYTIALQSDGKLIIGGAFTAYNGTAGNRIARLNTNGTLDATFNPGTGSDNTIRTTALQSDGKIIIGGHFTAYNGTGRNRIARVLVMPAALPVTLSFFIAQKKDNSALVQWKTASEINSHYFNVERSSDAINFQFIGKVTAAGNSSRAISYSFTDNQPLKGVNYYRLKQVDLDGRFTHSPVRFVRFGDVENGIIKYYPNPFNGILNIEIPEQMLQENMVINIFNAAGIQIAQIKREPNAGKHFIIDLKRFAKGTYFIQVKTNMANSTQRMVLQ